MTQIFAHRGSSGTHPENTLAAYDEAVRVGADGLELDAQMSRDGVLVVIHDERVDRITDASGWVKDFTLAELKQMTVKGHQSAAYPHAEIPTLAQVCEWAQANTLLLNIELKTGVVTYPHLEQHVLDMVKAYQLLDRVILSSFNHYTVQKLQHMAPMVPTALLLMEGMVDIGHYAADLGASALHCYWPIVEPYIITGAQKENLAVRPFTVNKTDALRQVLALGCHGVFTDYPEKAINIRDTYMR